MNEGFERTYNEVSYELFDAICKDNVDDNVMISPICLMSLLCMIAEASDGSTQKEVFDTLHWYNHKKYRRLLRDLITELQKTDKFNVANAVCTSNHKSRGIKNSFKSRIQKQLKGKVFTSDRVSHDVNSWVKEETKGMIPSIIDDSNIEELKAVMLSAASFESCWDKEYTAKDIHRDDFHNSDGTTSRASFMTNNAGRYIENKSFTGFVKMYAGGEYSYMALLPKEEETANDFGEVDITRLHRSSYDNTDIVIATIPEYRFETNLSIKRYLSDMGIEKAFTEYADFSPMAKELLMIGDTLQKSYIQVDRNGTKAAACMFSRMYGGRIEQPKIHRVVLDRPFIYAIIHENSGLPVFLGRVNKMPRGVYRP